MYNPHNRKCIIDAIQQPLSPPTFMLLASNAVSTEGITKGMCDMSLIKISSLLLYVC